MLYKALTSSFISSFTSSFLDVLFEKFVGKY